MKSVNSYSVKHVMTKNEGKKFIFYINVIYFAVTARHVHTGIMTQMTR